MELTRFDLIVIRNTLKHVIQTGEGIDLINKEIYQSVESAIEDILSEYQSDSVFLVQPDPIEENNSVFSVQTNMLEE